MNRILILIFIIGLLSGCTGQESPGLKFKDKGRPVPAFNADSAYHFVEKQVAFGPRVPNTPAHRQALRYLEQTLRRYAGQRLVYTQSFTASGYEEELKLGNIIAAFNPAAKDRILLSAHWDSRPRAEMDAMRPDDPLLGADDGGSGVAVLLELARLFKKDPPPIGVDLVLFDGEDYGKSGDLNLYFLGSRYWSQNPPVPGYNPRFGILLDMVGAKNAVFRKESYSMVYAPNLVDELWNIAGEKGYDTYFKEEEGAAVSDDHVIVNSYTGIPIINIINHGKTERGSADFAPHWHTHEDNMKVIGKNTLQAVGEVLTELIYNRL